VNRRFLNNHPEYEIMASTLPAQMATQISAVFHDWSINIATAQRINNASGVETKKLST